MTTLALQPCECRIRTWSLLLLAWVVSAIVLAASGALAASDLLIPALIGIPVAGFALGYRWNQAFREAALSLDTGVLVILHSWRMLGLGFLLLYAHDVLPGLFAWLMNNGAYRDTRIPWEQDGGSMGREPVLQMEPYRVRGVCIQPGCLRW